MSFWEPDENTVERYSYELDSMDASVFTGEMLYTNINEFEWYVRRWQKAIDYQREYMRKEDGMNYNESYEEWAESSEISKSPEGRGTWEHQQKKIDALVNLVKTYRKMPFPCHDYMAEEQWEDICNICNDE